jgi:clathrin heavy chain
MHDFVEELINYLYSNNKTELIELYIFRVSPKFSPKVLGSLIDLECDEKYLKKLLFNLAGNCPISEMIE